MKFVLEIDIDETVAVPELGRILRYWAGNLKHYDLSIAASETVYDSAYAPVGTWRATPSAGLSDAADSEVQNVPE